MGPEPGDRTIELVPGARINKAQALKADGPENQLRLLEMARDHLSQSIAFYGEIPGFANVAASPSVSFREMQ